MGGLSPVHWLIIVLALVILFGSKRLPDAARGLGKSLKIIKSEMRDLTEDDKPQLEGKVAPQTNLEADSVTKKTEEL